MTNSPNRPNPSRPRTARTTPRSQENQRQATNITQEIIAKIDGLQGSLQTYPIRDLVHHAEQFGRHLKQQRLETNQVRKFLDAINRLKSILAQENDFSKIETEVVLLKPKLAYAAAREKAAIPLSKVISKAIDKVDKAEDFERLVQFIESIIAYHKAEGGK